MKAMSANKVLTGFRPVSGSVKRQDVRIDTDGTDKIYDNAVLAWDTTNLNTRTRLAAHDTVPLRFMGMIEGEYAGTTEKWGKTKKQLVIDRVKISGTVIPESKIYARSFNDKMCDNIVVRRAKNYSDLAYNNEECFIATGVAQVVTGTLNELVGTGTQFVNEMKLGDRICLISAAGVPELDSLVTIGPADAATDATQIEIQDYTGTLDTDLQVLVISSGNLGMSSAETLVATSWENMPVGKVLGKVTKPYTGTATFVAGTALVGVGTKFMTEYKVGDLIWNLDSDTIADGVPIASITSDTALVLGWAYAGTAASANLGGEVEWNVQIDTDIAALI